MRRCNIVTFEKKIIQTYISKFNVYFSVYKCPQCVPSTKVLCIIRFPLYTYHITQYNLYKSVQAICRPEQFLAL